MAATDILPIGADKQLQITVLNANGSALDLSAYEGYAVILLYDKDATVIDSYCSNVVSGYNNDDIDTTNEATGIIVIDFQRAKSILGRPDALVNFIIQVQSTDSDYASSQFRDLTAPTACFRFGKISTTTADIS